MKDSWEDDDYVLPDLQLLSSSSNGNNDLILLLGGNPYEGQYGEVNNDFGISRQKLADNCRVYFVDCGSGSLIESNILPSHPRWFCVDFNDANAMLLSFSGLEGRFDQIYFDASTVKFFKIWSFVILHILLKPGGTIAWYRDIGFPLLDFFLSVRLPLQDFHSQINEVFGLEEGHESDKSLSMRRTVLDFNPHKGRVSLLVLKKSASKPPLIDLDTAMNLSATNTELTATEFHRIPPTLALQILDDMFSSDHRYVSLYHQRFYETYYQWLKRDRVTKDRGWLEWHQKRRNRYAELAEDKDKLLPKAVDS